MSVPRFESSLAVVAAFLVGSFAVSCMPDIPEDEPPSERVTPVFDPDAETIPLPNDAALDDKGTLPDLEGIEGDDATAEFLSWLTTLHGWLPATGIEVPFNGKLDESTVTAENVRLYEVKEDETLEQMDVESVEYDGDVQVEVSEGGEITSRDGSQVTIVPQASLEAGKEYAAAVTDDVKDQNGRKIVEPRPIFFAASTEPLVDQDSGEKLIESLPDDETAQTLERLRQNLGPVFEKVAGESEEYGREKVAVAFRWSTVKDPQTILDPDSGTIPQPNTAATDDDGSPIEGAFDSIGTETAQGYFESYLARLRGWPTTAPIEVPVANELDPSTVGKETVQLWRFTGENGESLEQVELESVEYDSTSGRISLTPADELGKRERFLAFATDEVAGAENGYSLKLPAPLKLAIQPKPVLEGGSSTVGRISDDQAETISGLREFLQPAVETMESETDVQRGDLGAIWTWETWKDTFAVFDPATGDIPLPNEFARRGEEGRVSLPTEDLSGLQETVVNMLNERRGFSTTAPGWIKFDAPIDPSTVTKSSVPLLWNAGIPEVYESNRYELEYKADWQRVLTRPTVPLNRDTEFDPTADGKVSLAIVSKDVKDADGDTVMPAPAFVFLRSPHPLFEDGSSTVDQLDDSTAQALEGARQTFNRLFQLAPQVGGLDIEDRSEISLAYGFHPENPVQPLQEFRAQALEKLAARGSNSVGRACEPDCSSDANEVVDPGATYQGPDGSEVDMSNVQRIQWAAEFDTVEFLQSDGSMADFSGASAETIGASVFLPKDSACPNKNPNSNPNEAFDVVIAQHGLGSFRVKTGMALANSLAGECLAVVATDFPKHGGRASGASSLHPDTNPSSSGDDFLSTDLQSTKGNLLQGAVDMTVLAQIVQNDGLEAAIDDDSNTDFFAYEDRNEVGYIGLSLGGFIGFPAATVDSNITTEVFTAAGGGYADVLTDGTLGGGILSALGSAGLEEGTFARFRALAFIQWVSDHVDPLAFAPFIKDDPLSEVSYDSSSEEFTKGSDMEPNDTLLQMATDPGEMDDPVVPNETTERLAESAGLSVSDSTYGASHGFLFDTDASSDSAADCARRQAAVFLANGLEGEASFPDSLKPSNCVN